MKRFFDSPQSFRRLLLIFITALLIFVGIRFEPESLLRSKVQEMAARSNVQFHFEQLRLTPLSLKIINVSLASSQIPAGLTFEQIAISPSWSSLFTGDLAIDIALVWQGNHGTARVKRSDENILLEEIRATIEAADLIQFVRLPIPLDVSGVSSLEGELLLNLRAKAPLAGHIDVSSESLAINVLGMEFPLVDILFHLEEKLSPSWQWNISAGKNRYLDANGTLEMVGLPTQWKADGLISLNTNNIENQTLNKFIKSISPKGDLLQARISGTLNRPHMEVLP